MEKLFSSVALASCMLFSATSSAQGGTFGIDYQMVSTAVKQSDIGLDLDFNITAVELRGSIPVDPMIDIEGTLAIGLGDDTSSQSYYFPPDVFTVQAKAELSYALGVFAKFHTDPSQGYQFYGKLGLQKVKVKAKETDILNGALYDTLNHSGDDIGLAYGAGASFNVGGNGDIFVEYLVYPTVDVDGADADSTGLSIGFQIPF